MKKKNLFYALVAGGIFLCAALQSGAQTVMDSLKEGERLFRLDRTDEAIPFLQKASSSGTAPQAFNYLGLCYHKKGELKMALDVFVRAMEVPGTDRRVLAFNAGNVCFDMLDFENAEKYYMVIVDKLLKLKNMIKNDASMRTTVEAAFLNMTRWE